MAQINYVRTQNAALELAASFDFGQASEGADFWMAVFNRLQRIATGEPLTMSGTIPPAKGTTRVPRPALPHAGLLEAAERVLKLRRPTPFRALDHVDAVALDLLHKSVEKANGKVDDSVPEVPGF